MRTSGIGRSLGAGLASILIASAEGQYSIDRNYTHLQSSERAYLENAPLVLPQSASLGERITLTGTVVIAALAGLYGIGRAAWRYSNKSGSPRRLSR